jgi:hypothetical protein
MNLQPVDPVPPIELTVVGERRNNPARLLLLGTDNNYYEYSPDMGSPVFTVPDDEWVIETLAVEHLYEETLPRHDL